MCFLHIFCDIYAAWIQPRGIRLLIYYEALLYDTDLDFFFTKTWNHQTLPVEFCTVRTSAVGQLHKRTKAHVTGHTQANAVTAWLCVRKMSVYLFDAVQFQPIFFSLSASYCSDRHSPAEPPSAPLVWVLSSPFLTNLSLIYLFLSPGGGCCQQQTAIGTF